MSRIGKKPVTVPSGVTVVVENNFATVKGPKGQLTAQFNADLTFDVQESVVEIARPSNSWYYKSFIKQYGCRSI